MAVAIPHIRLLDLMWEQILCKHVLPHLSLKELFILRGLSHEFTQLVDLYFSRAFTVRINRTFSQKFSSVAFEVLTYRNCCLKELSLDSAGQWLTDEALIAVLKNNPNLDTVDLSRCLFITDVGVGAIGEHCGKLHTLILEQCVLLTGGGLQSFISNSVPLEHVNLSECTGLVEDDLIAMIRYSQTVKVFILHGMNQITDRTVVAIAHSYPRLLHLNVSMSRQLTDHCIHIVREFCPSLESLHVMKCPQITERSLAKLRERNVRIDRPDELDHQYYVHNRTHEARYQI